MPGGTGLTINPLTGQQISFDQFFGNPLVGVSSNVGNEPQVGSVPGDIPIDPVDFPFGWDPFANNPFRDIFPGLAPDLLDSPQTGQAGFWEKFFQNLLNRVPGFENGQFNLKTLGKDAIPILLSLLSGGGAGALAALLGGGGGGRGSGGGGGTGGYPDFLATGLTPEQLLGVFNPETLANIPPELLAQLPPEILNAIQNPNPNLPFGSEGSGGSDPFMDVIMGIISGNRGGGGGGGGGGGRAGNSAVTSGALPFLTNLFGGGGQTPPLDPAIMQQIFGIGGQLRGTDLSQLNSLIGQNPLISALAGSVGLGGGGTDPLLQQLMGMLSGSSGGSFYGSNGGGGGAINTGLRELSPEIQARLNQILASEEGRFERFREQQNEDVLTRLFGQGVEQSTVAGEATNRSNEFMAQALRELLSGHAGRELGLMESQAGRDLEAQIAQLQAAAQRSAAASGAAASSNAARLGALSDIYTSRLGALSSLFGSQSQALANMFGTQTGGLSDAMQIFSNLALGNQQNQIAMPLGLGELATSILNTQTGADAQVRAARAGRSPFSDQLAALGLLEQREGRMQEGDLAQQRMIFEVILNQMLGQNRLDVANVGAPTSSDRWLQLLSILIPSFFPPNRGQN